jgi:hypothetical protein
VPPRTTSRAPETAAAARYSSNGSDSGGGLRDTATAGRVALEPRRSRLRVLKAVPEDVPTGIPSLVSERIGQSDRTSISSLMSPSRRKSAAPKRSPAM